MKIKAGQTLIALPEEVEAFTCDLFIYSDGDPRKNPVSFAICMERLDYERFENLKAQEFERPTFYCITSNKYLRIHPAPKTDTMGQLRYCPAMKVY